MPSSELATDADVSIGTSILAVGFPLSTDTGHRSLAGPDEQERQGQQKVDRGRHPVYEIDAAVSEGMSGGPTIDLNGKVIGVNSFGPIGESQAFNFVAPADSLATMLAGKGVKAMLGPADVSYRKGLDHYYAGHYTDAIKDFDQTLVDVTRLSRSCSISRQAQSTCVSSTATFRCSEAQTCCGT